MNQWTPNFESRDGRIAVEKSNQHYSFFIAREKLESYMFVELI